MTSWRDLVKPAADRFALFGHLPDSYTTIHQRDAAALATMLRAMARRLDQFEGRGEASFPGV